MVLPAPRALLRRLFESAGYRLEDRPIGLRAFRSRDHRAVIFVSGGRSPADLEEEFPAGTVHRTVLYPDDPGPEVRRSAAERGMEVLDPFTLGPGLGELLLLPSADPAGGGAAPLSGSTVLTVPPGRFATGGRIVAPRLGQADAEALAGVVGFRYVLRLLPRFIAAFRVRAASPHGGMDHPSEHLVAVNGISGRVEIWEEGERELVPDIPEEHEQLEPLLSPAEGRDLAETELRRRYTVSVDHLEQYGGAIVIERRRVPPGPEDLRIGPFVLVHAPFWYVESAEGRVVLDAVTGARAPTGDPDLDVVE
ncbi:MAG: hypothetical protein WA761_08765 [Thermoplasmata archaeon]